jgi:hypothetical protein
MPIVGGLDIHRKQLTFDYPGTVSGEVKRRPNHLASSPDTGKAAPRAVIRRSSCRWPLSAAPTAAKWTVSQPYIYTSPRLR